MENSVMSESSVLLPPKFIFVCTWGSLLRAFGCRKATGIVGAYPTTLLALPWRAFAAKILLMANVTGLLTFNKLYRNVSKVCYKIQFY